MYKNNINKILDESLNSRLRKLNEDTAPSDDKITVYMNTWANYNEYGADGELTPASWMSAEEAIDYCNEYAEYEPFINDIDNPTDIDLNISEYGNPVQDLEMIQRINQMSDYEIEELGAIMEDQGGSLEDAFEIFESGEYVYYPGATDYSDLAYEYIDMVGGLEGVSNPEYYIDEDAMRRDYEYDVRQLLYDNAKSEGIEDEAEIEEYIDENLDSYLDSIIEEEVYMAERGEIDLSNYFDYEAFGRNLSFDFTFTKNGAIEIY